MFKAKQSVLVVVDVQGKLAYLMQDQVRLFHNIQAVIKTAQILGIPVLWTEQVPEKIGDTVPEIAQLLKGRTPIRKTTFSCFKEKQFATAIKKLKRKQVVVVGIETHVCVYQTAADLIEHGFEVQVVADAVSSRSAENKAMGLDRIRQVGVGVTGTETIATELLQNAEGEKFRAILSLIK